ncbi:short transient receptor potential channel 4-like [Ptychodera flava]|uniref:short transient receptor potential channel 4-like n=1 Tax=Ptychodera flava TaxID=63121 RepID=UPI00396A9EBF
MEGSNSMDSLQKLYFSAVERADVRTLQDVLKQKSRFDVDAVNADGKTAFQLAIKCNSTDVIRILLHHNVNIGDALFHAIEKKFTKAIELILNHPQGQDLIDAHAGSSSEEFHPDTTPLILAAHHNDHDIIKLLIKRGATPIAVSSYQTENHTIQRSIGTLNVYKALASEAYICVIETETETKPDPFQRAFELCHKLRAESSKEYEFREEYLELAAKCEQFSADLLGQTRDSIELKTVLSHDSQMSKRGVGKEGRPMKVLYAVQRQHKKFVVHPHCQQQLIELWYRGLENWRESSWIRNVVISTLIILAFPVLGLLYLIYPYGRYGRFMRIPYVKFLMHSASYMWFLAFLFMSTTHLEDRIEDDREFETEKAKLKYQKRISEQRGTPPTKVELLIVIWVVGMTWREIREMWNSGLSDYLTNPWNILDLIQLTLYWAWLGLRIASIIMFFGSSIDLVDSFFGNTNTSTQIPFGNIPFGGFGGIVFFVPNETALQSDFDSGIDYASETSFNLPSPQNATMNPALEERLHKILDAIAEVSDKIETSATYEEAVAKISLQLEMINQAVSDLAEQQDSNYLDELPDVFENFMFAKPRGQWDQYDPTLLADLIMAVANVISVIRFLRVMVINEYVGPLQISVGKMLRDIMKFMFIFGLVWVAFAVGLTQVYWGYGPESMLECMKEDSYAECYGRRFFADISASLKTLFWSLYGLIDLEALQVEADHLSTEFVGGLLFAIYQIAAVIILLNLLIALMGTTYDSIVENADIEWKFYRSDMWMDYFSRGVTQAPPFNVLPTSKFFINVFRRVYHCCCCRKDVKVQAKARQRSESAKESQEYYEVVCRRLIQRYLADRSADCPDNLDCSYASRSDLLTFRFEICDMIQRLEQSIGQLREELRDKLPGIADIDSRQQDESNVTIEDKGTTAEVQPTVSELQSAEELGL